MSKADPYEIVGVLVPMTREVFLEMVADVLPGWTVMKDGNDHGMYSAVLERDGRKIYIGHSTRRWHVRIGDIEEIAPALDEAVSAAARDALEIGKIGQMLSNSW